MHPDAITPIRRDSMKSIWGKTLRLRRYVTFADSSFRTLSLQCGANSIKKPGRNIAFRYHEVGLMKDALSCALATSRKGSQTLILAKKPASGESYRE